ncbi:hypothetical protein EV122DRAFT_205686 [Schizophyllum commune]
MSAPAPRQKRATKAWLIHGYWVSNQQRTEIQQHRQKHNLLALETSTSTDDPLCKITSREVIEMLKTMQVNAKETRTRTPGVERVLLETDDEDDDQETCVSERLTPAPVDLPPKAASSVGRRPVPQEVVQQISALAKLRPPFWYKSSNPAPLAPFDHEHICVHCGQVLVPESDPCATPKARTAVLPATAPCLQTRDEIQQSAMFDPPLGPSQAVDCLLTSTNSASRPRLQPTLANDPSTVVGSEDAALPVKVAKRVSGPRSPSPQPNHSNEPEKPNLSNEITDSAQKDSSPDTTSPSLTPSSSPSNGQQSAPTPNAKLHMIEREHRETSGIPPRFRRKCGLVCP